jgi:uroporphyrinogen III methyltransferase/synthase
VSDSTFDRARPLDGVRVLVTRSGGQARALAELLRERGARPALLPTLAIVEPERWNEVDACIARLDDYDGILFTSANAVAAFCDRVDRLGKAPDLGRVRMRAAVGPETAGALVRRALTAEIVAEEHTAEGLFAALSAEGLEGRRFLLPCGDRARDALPALLSAAGATVDTVVVYRTVPDRGPAEAVDALRRGEIDVITLLSPSAAEGLMLVCPRESIPACALVAVIGPTTRATCERLGLRVDIEAAPHTLSGLVQAIEEHLPRRS